MADGTVDDQIPELADDEQVKTYNPEAWTFATDADGDLRITDRNKFALTSGTEAIALHLKVALATKLGEDPIDDEYGLDLMEATRSQPSLKRELRQTILHDDFRHDRISSVGDITITGPDAARSNLSVDIQVYLNDGDPVTFMFDLFTGSLTFQGVR